MSPVLESLASFCPGSYSCPSDAVCSWFVFRCDEVNLSESELAASEVVKADKSLFIQELLIQTLSTDVESLELNGQPTATEGETKESETVDQSVSVSSEPSVITIDSASEATASDLEKLLSLDGRLPSIEDEEEEEVSDVAPQVVTDISNQELDSTPITVSVDPGPDENEYPATAVLSATSTFTTSSCQSPPITTNAVGKLRSSQSVDAASVTTTSTTVPSTTDPLSVLTPNFITPAPVSHALVSGGASGGVPSRGTSPAWPAAGTTVTVPLGSSTGSRSGPNIKRSNSTSGASSSGPSHPVKRGPPPSTPATATQSTGRP